MHPSEESERDARIHQFAFDLARSRDDHVWRPSVFEGMYSQEPVMEGKLTPFNWLQICWTSLPWFPRLFNKVVPSSYIAEDLNSDGYSAATVACPCGEPHEVEIGTPLNADCGRSFAWFGERVLVANASSWAEETTAG